MWRDTLSGSWMGKGREIAGIVRDKRMSIFFAQSGSGITLIRLVRYIYYMEVRPGH